MLKCYNLSMDNPVGSLEVPTNLHARKCLCLSMSERQREILIGCVLGDAYMTKLGKIRIEQKIKYRERHNQSPDLADALVLACSLYGWEPQFVMRVPSTQALEARV